MKSKQYKYGFHDTIKNKFAFKKGLNEQVIRAISKSKNEPA